VIPDVEIKNVKIELKKVKNIWELVNAI
jgi:hypothetical protein